jgi:hypothetical protein
MGPGWRKTVEAVVRRRSIERLITIVGSLALIAMAVLLIDEGASVEGSTKLDVNAGKGTVSVALERYGPSVALVALAVILVPFVFLSPLKIKLPAGTILYADARAHAESRSLALSRDEFVELRDAATRARQADPHGEAAILLSRISKSVFERGCITPAELERRSELLTKLNTHRLAPDERRELVRLQQLLTEKDAASWMREADFGNSREQRLASSKRAGEAA